MVFGIVVEFLLFVDYDDFRVDFWFVVVVGEIVDYVCVVCVLVRYFVGLDSGLGVGGVGDE